MKIVIFSNCQGESLALSLEAMNPDIQTKYIISSEISKNTDELDKICEESDYIFIQKHVEDSIPDQFKRKVVYFPVIAFSAFHPDITYVRAKRKDNGQMETVNSLMVSYHSAIALFGYLRGIPIEKIIGFYNPYVFSKLRYIDGWEESRKLLIEEGLSVDMPLETLLNSWQKRGCFMYSFNHPELKVMSDIGALLLKKIGVDVVNKNPDRYLNDPLKAMPIWPIYPQISDRYHLQGDYSFKRHDPHGVINLYEFIQDAYATYDQYEKETLEPLNFNVEKYNELLGFTDVVDETVAKKRSTNPYMGLPDVQFWKKSFPALDISHVDPATKPKFTVKLGQKIATAGSCFAQHIARTLSSNGFNYFVPEVAPQELDELVAYSKNYGVYSARYGNLYTARQLLQLFERAYGTFTPEETIWYRKDGKIVDPFRPQIEPNGFDTVQDAEESRQTHFHAVRKMFEEMEVFIFTLGLTEGWRSRHDGAVYPLAPGVSGGEMDKERYEFVNFTVEEVTSDLEDFLESLSQVNKSCKVILTVSPVPLVATYEHQHALVATTYSKSVLRVAAENLKRKYDYVEYFPSYEIITGSFNKGIYFDEDLRTVKEEGVSHVMRLFLKHNTIKDIDSDEDEHKSRDDKTIRVENKETSIFRIVCDEELIVKFDQ